MILYLAETFMFKQTNLVTTGEYDKRSRGRRIKSRRGRRSSDDFLA